MAQPPYMLIPQNPNGTPAPATRNTPFNVAQAVSSLSSTASNLTSAAAPNAPPTAQTAFRAPAHKHAHHLHTIPPREKSTRTLIIDHMLWVHGRTRFAQARAELGMTDRTGGPSSPNYAHRRRPENYEEEDQADSEGEDVGHLKARDGRPQSDEEDDRLGAQDLPLARNLRLRAEGLEKVVTSMLEQPPPIHTANDEDIFAPPPTSPSLNASGHRDSHYPHTLPNGVRLRLALGTVINDLFARQAPRPPYRHRQHSKTSTPSGQSPPETILSASTLPPALTSLFSISKASTLVPSGHSYTNYKTPASSILTPSPRTRSLYMVGADPSTANSPPAFRCPRHLHTGCEICVEAKSGGRQLGARGRSDSFSGDYNTTRGNQSNSWKGMPGGVGPGGGGITGWQDGSGIGSGLLKPGVGGSALRRKINEEDSSDDSVTGAGNTKLSELIPRFIRLSALVAAELGREAREDDDDESGSTNSSGQDEGTENDGDDWANVDIRTNHGEEFTPLPEPSSPSTARAIAQAHDRMYEYSLRPSREWYMLLAGLLTRAVLEGYLTAGWRGSHAVECLLTVGLGIVDNADRKGDTGDQFAKFDPDDLPSLLDAIKLLFPGLRTVAPLKKGQVEEEFEAEMYERLQRFYDIPPSTPDLSTHMEDLAWQFPAEPVERAAVRFCEAIAKWRGKPELETYKKKPPQDVSETSGNSTITIESLVHSNPTSPTMGNAAPSAFSSRRTRKPSIDIYFSQPLFRDTTWTRNKRPRSPDNGRSDPSKRTYESQV